MTGNTPPTSVSPMVLRREAIATRLAVLVAIVAVLVGGIVLVGWWAGLPILRSFLPAWDTMKANTALCFVLLGAAMLLLAHEPPAGWRRGFALACGLLVLIIGLLTLLEYLSGLSLGIDQVLARESGTRYPGRMAPNTALSLPLLGLGVALPALLRAGGYRISQYLVITAGLPGLLGLLGHLYQARALFAIGSYTSMAVHTAVLIFLLAIGLLCICPRQGMMIVMLSDGPGGHNLRMLWPTLFLLTVGFGWLAELGVRFERYDVGLALALAITAVILAYSAILLANAVSLERADFSRRRAEADLRRLNDTLEGQVRERTAALEASNDELRRSEERFRLMIESVKDYAIILLDPEGHVVSWNVGAERIKGYRAEEILGQSFTVFYTPEDIAAGKPQRELEEAQANGRFEDESWRVRKDGSRFWANVIVTPLYTEDGALFGFVKVTRDISERRRAEEQLRALNADLLRRTAELEASNKELEDFSYSVAHDLRSPLRSVDGFSKYLLEHATARLNTQEQNYLQRMRKAAQRMGHLIDDLLNLARISRMSMTVEAVDLSALAEELLDDLRQRDPDRRVTVEITPGLVVNADRELLRMALAHLLDNAWKFTNTREQARITVGMLRKDDRTVYFVRDNGVGFDMAYADKLFQPFHRLHTEEEFPGTGIGLALVQRIIQRHGGRVWAESAVEQGATVYFTLWDEKR